MDNRLIFLYFVKIVQRVDIDSLTGLCPHHSAFAENSKSYILNSKKFKVSFFLNFVIKIYLEFRVLCLEFSLKVVWCGHVSWEGYVRSRSGVTEREDQSVCIDCTWKA